MTLQSPNEEPASEELSSNGTAPALRGGAALSVRSSAKANVGPRLPNGFRAGKYEIIRLIASGGMSEVYEAEHLGLRKRVAFKLMRGEFAANSEARQRFLSEGTNAARIRHSNVVDVTDVGMVLDLPYLVMSLLEGEDLATFFAREAPLPLAELVDLMLPVALAVAAGHAQGVVHRDLKPDNVFLHREGCRLIPKVLDFGISRLIDAKRITLNATVFGTPHYMSPEQARGAATDARTDQYALGVILYEGVTGCLPRNSQNPLEVLHALAFDSFRPPSTYVELPPGLEATILRAMAHEPESRFRSMNDLALSLLPFATPAAREYWQEELRSPRAEDAPLSPTAVVRRPSLPPRLPLATPVRAPVPGAGAAEQHAAAGSGGAPSIDSLQPAVATIGTKRHAARRRLAAVAIFAGLSLAAAATWIATTPDARRATGIDMATYSNANSIARSIELSAPVAREVVVIANPTPPAPPVSEPLEASAAPAPVIAATKPRWHKPKAPLRAVEPAPAHSKPPRPEAARAAPAATAPTIAVIDAQQPKVRLIDEPEARVRVVE